MLYSRLPELTDRLKKLKEENGDTIGGERRKITKEYETNEKGMDGNTTNQPFLST
ncbi:MAG: hypothetical protein IPJ07_23415 [Acidobacteria bacterium]|nr:hypothetical protein [Acidobacteriota bacterium]